MKEHVVAVVHLPENRTKRFSTKLTPEYTHIREVYHEPEVLLIKLTLVEGIGSTQTYVGMPYRISSWTEDASTEGKTS